MLQRVVRYVLAILAFQPVSRAADWNSFLGPSGNGISREETAPVTWGPDTNIKWKAKLPRPGNGSPIVSAGRVFVACAEDDKGRRRSLYCFDRADGKPLWVRSAEFDKEMPTHDQNPYCGSTPAADGRHVIVWHASAGLYCYGFDGTERWRRDLGEFRHRWGYGSSPIIYRDRVILYCGPGERTFVTAINLETGETIWETQEPQQGNGQDNADGKYMGSWSTPVVANVGGRDQIVCSHPTRLVAYDPATGDIIWFCDGLRGPRGDLAYASPMIRGDLCVAIGGFMGPGIGLKLGDTGDVTGSARRWRSEKNPQNIGTGVFLDQHIYRANAGPGTIDCIEAQTGNVVWTDRAAGGDHWGSVVYAGGHLYATNQDGTTTVFRPNPQKFELVASNELGEPTNATPAISDAQIFIRTFEHLYCIADSITAKSTPR